MAKVAIQKASTNVTVYLFIQDSSSTTGAGLTGLVYNSAGLACYYVRPLAAAAALSLATQTVTGAHSDGGFVEIDSTNMPGIYRLDLSDAICATGVDSVVVVLKGATNMATLPLEIQLTTFDLNDASPEVTLASETHTGAVIPTVTTLTGHTAQTGDSFARIGVAGAGLTNIDLPDQTMNITGNLSGSVGSVTAGVTVTTNNDKTGYALSAAGVQAIWDALTSALVTVGSVGKLLVDNINATISSRMATTHIDATAGKVDGVALVDTTTTNTDMRGTDNAATAAALTTHDNKLGTIADLGAGATVGNNLSDIAGATFATGTDSLEAIRDRGDAAWVTGAGGSDRLLMVDTTIATLASQTSFTLAGGSTDDDAYNNCTIVIEDVSTAAQKAVGLVSDYTGATKTVTLKYDPGIFTMATTDKVYILAENALKSTDANRQLDVTATGAAGIDWANIENPTTAVDLSGTDIQLVDTTTTNTDMRGTDSAATAAALSTHDGKLDTVDANVDSILTDTGTTLPASIAALNDISVADVLTTQMTEAYAADGAAPTVAQALHMIQQMLGEFAISGTTLTVKKVDGSTTAGTFTLDDATTPTSITRAT